jgi:hypothetical protein
MSTLKNPRHEAFAQALASGMSGAAAYVEAGYEANAVPKTLPIMQSGGASTLPSNACHRRRRLRFIGK